MSPYEGNSHPSITKTRKRRAPAIARANSEATAARCKILFTSALVSPASRWGGL